MQEMEMTTGEVKEKLDRGDKFVLLDVRDPNEYEVVHLEGATLIPLDQLQQRVSELNKDEEVVIYCHHGSRSLQAARYLQASGYKAHSMNGGIEDWAEKIDPTLPRY